MEMDKKSMIGITRCISCESHYYHRNFISERKNGVSFKPGKTYCLFPKKPIKLDGRKRHMEIPANCPRHCAPIRFAVYTPKKRVQEANADENAKRFWRALAGDINMVVRSYIFSEGTYSEPVCKDGFLWNEDAPVHKLLDGDVVVREDGFTLKSWRWNGEFFTTLIKFDEKGIRKMPEKRG